MSDELQVAKLARIRCRADQATAFRAALLTLETQTRQEPGCLEFTFLQALSDDTSFVLLERFQNEAALQLHLQAPYTQRFFDLGWLEDLTVGSI